MDFEDIESECSSSNFFNDVRIRESGVSQDSQYRPRKSPRKRLKVARTSVSLMIDQLKSVFWYPNDFMSRIRTRRNWRPEFLIKHFCDNRRSCNKECDAILRHGKRNFVPEVPKIYSIGLRSGARCLSDSDDLSSSYGAIRNFKKRFSIIRRPTIICKYWIAQSTPTSSLSTDVSLKAHADRQTMIIDCTKSTEIAPQCNWTQKNNHNSHHSQLYEHIEKKESDISDTLRNDHAADDYSVISDDFKDPSVRKDHKYDSSCITRDAQIQTSNRRSSRRRKIKTRSKPTTEKISHRKRYNNEPRIVADFCTPRSRSSSRRNHRDKPWLRVRVLENKRAEYINKFTAVNRQIEEITATLRETCCDGDNSQSNLENCEYFSSISDDAKVNTINWSDVESRSTIARGRSTSEEKNGLMNVKRIVAESKSDRCENVQEILRVDNLNNETVSSPKETIASSRNPEKIPNDASDYDDSVRAMKETVYPSNKISRTRAKCRFVKQMSFDLDLAKNRADELQERSIENDLFHKVCLNNNFAILNIDEHARDLAESLANLDESRYCKIIEEKIGEMIVLEDIKKRIDRDFDDPPDERSENDTEDFLTVSQNGSNFRDRHDIIDVTSATTIEESKSTPLIVPTSPDPTETEIHNSMSIGAMSEYSNKNSALSKYFSCTRIPSLAWLTRNEDEHTVETVDRAAITYDSHSNLHSNYHYYDSRSSLSPNNCSFSNLDSSFDRSRCSLEYRIARYDSSAQHTSSNKFLTGTANEPYNTFEISEGQESVAADEIREWEHPPVGESKRDRKERRVEKRYTADSTLETSKSSRYVVGSVDSGVFSSSLIDLYPAENSLDVGRAKLKKKRRAGELEELATVDSGSDSSCTDDTLDRQVNDIVRDLTKNLILCERKARMKLKARDARHSQQPNILSHACKLSRNFYDTCCDLFNSSRRGSSEDERIVSISTPSLLSLSDSEIEDCNESRRQRVFR